MFDWNYIEEIDEYQEFKDKYCDEEISEQYRNDGLEFIKSFMKGKFSGYHKNGKVGDIIPSFYRVYKYDDMIVTIFMADEEDNDFDYEFIFLQKGDKFLCIGSRCSHSMIATNEYMYVNSDGSSASFIDIKSDINKNLENTSSFFKNVSENKFH